MNLHDEELQNEIERGGAPNADPGDVHAYREVFRVLRKQGEAGLPAGFAERVVERIVSAQRRRDRRDYFWFAIGVLFLAVSALATILYTGSRIDFGFFKAMGDYKGLCAFAVVFVIFLNWLDRRFIRGSHSGVI